MKTLNDFVIQEGRILPVIIAVDRSGSMGIDGKIDALNLALNNFIESIKEEKSTRAEIQMSIFSFGGDKATCDLELSPLEDIIYQQYAANGRTPMGETFKHIKDLLENKERITSRSYKPTIVLLTDGVPTDEYEEPMKSLISEGRSSKAFRIAMAIGEEADNNMLSRFVSSPEHLISGENARDIKKFFRFVTMSVTQRMKSQTPDKPESISYDDIEEFDF